MTYKAQFTGLLKATASDNEQHPLQAIAEFVFTDFTANANKQGVQSTEALNILKSGLNQPVKVDFTGHRIGDHDYALPVGSITHMEHKEDKIIGKAVIWRNEFPDLFEYLLKASASEGGVQFSWELMYKDKELDSNGVQWLKDVVVAGIAIVSNPAYAGRTPLLALASEKRQASLQQLSEKVAAVIEGLEKAGAIENASETSHMELEAVMTAVEGLKADIIAVREKLDAVKIEAPAAELLQTEASEELTALKSEVEELRAYKTEAEASKARAELLSARTQALAGLMSDSDISDKADFILALADEQFTAFIASLQSVASKQPAKASDKGRISIPDPLTQSPKGDGVSIRDIAQSYLKMREGA